MGGKNYRKVRQFIASFIKSQSDRVILKLIPIKISQIIPLNNDQSTKPIINNNKLSRKAKPTLHIKKRRENKSNFSDQRICPFKIIFPQKFQG